MYMSLILAKAIEYAAHGMSVMPVKKDKRPLLSNWKILQEKPADMEQIEQWWTANPQANVAIITGKISNLIVVDVDTYAGATDIFPDTYTVKTGNGGLQKYYQYTPGFTISANGYPTMPHVDIRSDGGYVVAAPSVTDYLKDNKKAGGPYTVLNNVPYATSLHISFPPKSPNRNPRML